MKKTPSQLIKKALAKLNSAKIDSYLQEYPKSKTLRLIARFIKEIQATNDEQLISKLGTRIAYHLDSICDPKKAGYVKNEEEKKHFLEISEELFKNTVGVRE